MSQQMFKIAAARSNTHLKSFAPLIDCSVYPALLELVPHCHDTLLQLVDILNRLRRLGLVEISVNSRN